MRCEFCGWDNPQGQNKCEKCNKPLAAESPVGNKPKTSGPVQSNSQSAESQNLRATVREGAAQLLQAGDAANCPQCGYPMENGCCPQCGYKEEENAIPTIPPAPIANNKEPKHQDSAGDNIRHTVRPNRKGEKEGRFILTPISEENGLPEGDLLEYEGNEVVLNRSNTDPKNSTITSQEQAVITHADGLWKIEDHSELRTTFVQAIRPVELKNGDLLLLGNQLYRFDAISY